MPASGKSTLVRRLVARRGLRVLAKDDFKEALFERLGTGDAAWSRRLSDEAFAALFAAAASQLAAGAALLLEGNFRAGEHEPQILEACDGHRPRIAQLLCRSDEPGRRARLEARAVEASRHRGHRDADALEALRTGHAAGPGAPSDCFLDLPGPRFVYDSSRDAEAGSLEAALLAIEHWLGPAR